MNTDLVKLGALSVSRFIIGGNPFSGFSHQTHQRDAEMLHYHTVERIKDTLRRAEALGVTTHLGRADHFVMRVLLEYWNEGGTIQWIAQTCPEVGSTARCVQNAVYGGAKACFIHGGRMDCIYDQGDMSEVAPAIAQIREAGLAAGIASHRPEVIRWAEEHVDVDFYMCSYYNPIVRKASGEHAEGVEEVFEPANRDAMVETIAGLSKPAIHYKVMAAGRTPPREALEFVARHLRPQDAVCVGICTRDNADMIEENLRILRKALDSQ